MKNTTDVSEVTPFEQAANERPPGFFAEFLLFLGENKKWWMLPILISLLLFGVLVMLSGSVAAPFIYPLF